MPARLEKKRWQRLEVISVVILIIYLATMFTLMLVFETELTEWIKQFAEKDTIGKVFIALPVLLFPLIGVFLATFSFFAGLKAKQKWNYQRREIGIKTYFIIMLSLAGPILLVRVIFYIVEVLLE